MVFIKLKIIIFNNLKYMRDNFCSCKKLYNKKNIENFEINKNGDTLIDINYLIRRVNLIIKSNVDYITVNDLNKILNIDLGMDKTDNINTRCLNNTVYIIKELFIDYISIDELKKFVNRCDTKIRTINNIEKFDGNMATRNPLIFGLTVTFILIIMMCLIMYFL